MRMGKGRRRRVRGYERGRAATGMMMDDGRERGRDAVQAAVRVERSGGGTRRPSRSRRHKRWRGEQRNGHRFERCGAWSAD